MLKMKSLFISSYKEMKNVRSITLIAMFGAISIIFGMFLTVMLWDFLKVGFTFLPNEFVYYLFGPFVGIIYGGTLDILTYLVKPMGAFFPGFTISGILTGLLYGMLLYKRPLSLWRIVLVNILRSVFIDLILNTYWLTILNGEASVVMLPMRALKLFIMLPVESILLFAVIKGVEASGILKLLQSKSMKKSPASHSRSRL